MEKNPQIFISYAHDDELFADKILSFSNKLRSKGIDAIIDQYEDSPPEGWHRWMENQIMQSDYVLVVCTQLYYQKCHCIDNKAGRGVSWEVLIIYQHLYDSHSNNTKFILVIFENDDWDNVLIPLKSATIYNVGETKDFDDLYWRLRDKKKVEKPPLGELTPLPTKERVQVFFFIVNKY
jgi:hypothetical protein